MSTEVVVITTRICDKCGRKHSARVTRSDDMSFDHDTGPLPDGWAYVVLNKYPRKKVIGDTDEQDRFADICPKCTRELLIEIRARTVEEMDEQ